MIFPMFAHCGKLRGPFLYWVGPHLRRGGRHHPMTRNARMRLLMRGKKSRRFFGPAW